VDLYLFRWGIWCRNNKKLIGIFLGNLTRLVLICEVDFLKVYPSRPPICPILGTPLLLAHPRTFSQKYQGPDQSSRQAVKYKNLPSRHFQKKLLNALLFPFISEIVDPGWIRTRVSSAKS
jgi:hypothetical protein